MMSPWPLAWAQLRRNATASLAVALLIAAAVAFTVSMSAAERALRQSSARAADRFDLLVGKAVSPLDLVLGTVYLRPGDFTLVPREAIERIRADRGVASASPIVTGDSVEGYAVVGTTPDLVTANGRAPLAEGRLFSQAAEAVVGSRVGYAIGARLQASHGMPGESDERSRHDLTCTVVGRMAPTGTPWDRAVVVPIAAMWKMHHHEDAGAGALAVRPRTVGDAYRLRQALREQGLVAVFPAEVMVQLHDVLGGMRDFTLFTARAGQALVVAAIVLALLATVAMRRQPNAVLRALGAPARYVFLVSWLQCFAVFAAGTVLGLAGGCLAALALGQVMQAYTGMDVAVSLAGAEWREAALQLAALAIAATIPAAASLRGAVAEALRSA